MHARPCINFDLIVLQMQGHETPSLKSEARFGHNNFYNFQGLLSFFFFIGPTVENGENFVFGCFSFFCFLCFVLFFDCALIVLALSRPCLRKKIHELRIQDRYLVVKTVPNDLRNGSVL